MFNFNLKPGHTNPADGLLDSVGAFDFMGRLVVGHSNTADGLLVAQQFYQAAAPAGGPPSYITGVITGSLTLSASGTAQEVILCSVTSALTLTTVATAQTVVQVIATGGMSLSAAATGSVESATPPQPPIGGRVYWNSPPRRAVFDVQAEEDELIALTLNHFLNN